MTEMNKNSRPSQGQPASDQDDQIKTDVFYKEDVEQNIWKSKLSWKITLSVFATMVVIQAAVMVFTVNNFEQEKLYELRQTGLNAVAPLIGQTTSQLSSPIQAGQAQKLLEVTPVKGLSIYSMDVSQLATYGETTALYLSPSMDLNTTYWSVDETSYEVIYSSSDLRRPYFIVAKLDSSNIASEVSRYVKQNIMILLLLAAFVTSVLMIALSQLLLEPILLLRKNLLNAVRNPQKPQVQELRSRDNDEVTLTVNIANDLIRQNADNLAKLREQAEDQIHQLAYYDNLTKLPNRTMFAERLDQAIQNHVVKKEKSIVVMSLDLDHFKDINDSLGHEMGDMLLEAVAERLVNATPADAIVSRASADEFSILAFLDGDISESSEIVDDIYASLAEPLVILQEKFQVRASIGLAHCPQDGMEVSHIMKNADIALNRAKEDGRATYRFYSEDFDRAVQSRFQMLRDLRLALEGDQFKLHYHPQFDLKTGKMIGAEALLRWYRPDNSPEGSHLVSPVEFIPIAEQSGLIVPIGEWVMETACKAAVDWQKQGLDPIRMAVNISGIQFHRGDIVNMVKRVLNDTGLDPRLLELEVTESVFMDDINQTIDILRQLHELGCELAIDDFGTGYSSLSYLRQFPIDRLKIDQSFVRDVLTNNDDQAITRTIINLGHSLGLKVIAEGVETTDHQNFLLRENCDEVQGFKYTKPIPINELLDYGKAYNNDLEKPSKDSPKLSVI